MEQSLWYVGMSMVVALVMLILLRRRSSLVESTEWPVGPRKIPVVGNLHQLGRGVDLLHVTLKKLARVHGRAMTIWLGSWQPVIVVSDEQPAWEVLVNKSADYASRGLPFFTKINSANWQTINTSNLGQHWHTLRRGLQNGALSPLNISAQNHLQEEDIVQMTESMREEASMNDGIVKPLLHIRRTTVQLLARLCFGRDFKDETFVRRIDRAVEDTISITGHTRLVDTFPLTRYIPGLNSTFKKAYQVKHKIEQLIGPFLNLNPPPHCYLHFLLSQNLAEQVIIFCIFELFLLGLDSTSSTAIWALAFLIHNRQSQQKLYDEIKGANNTSEGQLVRTEVSSKLQYLHAIVKETMRMKPIAPLGVPHKAAKETKLMGSRVAEGTQVVVNLYAIHHDPKIWSEPHQFMPERFLPSAGDTRLRATDQSFLPFGAGMRVCAGMELGKLHIALVIANLINAFHWSCSIEGKFPDLSEELTFVLMMKTPLTAGITPRIL